MLVRILQLDHVYEDDAHCSSHFISKSTQLAFRAVALGYCVSTLISNFVYTDSITFFTFFTNLSYMLLTLYFGVIVFLSAKYNDYTKSLSSSKVRAVNILLEVVATNALFLDIVYWTMLYRLSASEYDTMRYFYCFNVHLINLIIISTEVATNKLRFFARHLAFTLLFLTIYSAFSIILYLLTDTWVYPILDWHNAKAPFIYAGCYALNITCFFAMYGAFRLRERIAAKKHGSFVLIQNLEAGSSMPSFSSLENSYGKIPLVPKSFAKTEEPILAKPEMPILAKPEMRESCAKSERFDKFVSYGSMGAPPAYPVQYPILAFAGSGAQ